jgi:hypothetical protein
MATNLKELASLIYGKEGVDHVNVSLYSGTKLGKLLHPQFRSNFFIPNLGDFISAMAFVHWLGGAGEAARIDPSIREKVKIVPFKEAIIYAKFCQLKKNTRLLMENKELIDLGKFTSYKVFPSGVREIERNWLWYVELLPILIPQVLNKNLKEPIWQEFGFHPTSLKAIELEVKKNVVGNAAQEEPSGETDKVETEGS